MYTKDLEHLLRILQVSRQSGLLTVELAEQEEAHWQGWFRLVEGKVTACQVTRKADGHVLLSNEEALRWLITQGKLNWSLQEEGGQLPGNLLPSLLPPGSATGEIKSNTGNLRANAPTFRGKPGWIPRRTLKGMHLLPQSLASLEHRQVFTLVNGQNSVEGIARLLRKLPDNIYRILNELRSAGMIE